MEGDISTAQLSGVLGVIAATWLARRFGGKAIPALRSHQAGVYLAFAFSAAIEFGQALALGEHFSKRLILKTLFTTASAVGLYTGVRKGVRGDTPAPENKE